MRKDPAAGPPARRRPGALVLAALGRFEEALPLLVKFPPTMADRLYWEPMFDPIRDDPRFQQLMMKLGREAEYRVACETLARMVQEQAAKK